MQAQAAHRGPGLLWDLAVGTIRGGLRPSPNSHTSCPQEQAAAWRGGGESPCQALETLSNGPGAAAPHPARAAVCLPREQNRTSGRNGFVKQMWKGSPDCEAEEGELGLGKEQVKAYYLKRNIVSYISLLNVTEH